MAKSVKVTVTEASDGAITVAHEDASIFDIVTTLVSTDTVVTGMYGLTQKVALFAGGMSVQQYRNTGSFNPLNV